jgi:hypothetical protein
MRGPCERRNAGASGLEPVVIRERGGDVGGARVGRVQRGEHRERRHEHPDAIFGAVVPGLDHGLGAGHDLDRKLDFRGDPLFLSDRPGIGVDLDLELLEAKSVYRHPGT